MEKAVLSNSLLSDLMIKMAALPEVPGAVRVQP